MAIVPAKTTEKSDAVAMAGVMKTLGGPTALTAGGASARKKKPSDLAAPHDVYTLSLKDFNKGLSKAKRTALRYLVMSGNHAVAAADLERSTSTAKPKWLHLNQGSLVSASLAALESAELLSATQKDDFELRVLQIPAIHAIALWLHGKKTDLLIPLDAEFDESIGESAVSAPLTPKKFFRELKSQAQLVSGFDDSPGSPAEETASKKAATKKSIKKSVAKKTTKKAVPKKAAKKALQKKAAKKVTAKKATKKAVPKRVAPKPVEELEDMVDMDAMLEAILLPNLINSIRVKPAAAVADKIAKLGRVRTGCLQLAASPPVVQIGQGLDVRLFADSGSIFDVDDRVTFLQTDLTAAELKLVGAASGSKFAAAALALAEKLATLGENEGLWTRIP